MKFLPYENFYISTSLKPDEVQERLSREVETPQGFSFKNLFSSTSRAYFSGYVGNGMFEFKRIINYRNSFLPEIKGTTEACLNGSRVHVKMTMLIFVTIFISTWMGLAAVFGIAFLIQQINKGQFSMVDFAPFLMLLFGYLLTMGGFKLESSKARDKLLELLDGELEQ